MSIGRFLTHPLPFAAEDLRRMAYRDPTRFPVLLDSAATGPLGRYSMLACLPREVLWQDGYGRVSLERAGQQVAAPQGGFLAALEQLWEREHCRSKGQPAQPDSLFHGGWILYLGYELATEIEPKLRLVSPQGAQRAAPAAFALRVPAALVFDHERGCGFAVLETDAEALLPELADALQQARSAAGRPPVEDHAALLGLVLEEDDPERFVRAVDRALEHIRAGDIYQANLSRRWSARWPVALNGAALHETAAALYERLRVQNPAPFAALACFRDWRLLSSSPERLVRTAGRLVETRPIAGTRPRSRRVEADRIEIEALIAHPKERAEHIMLVDLERNDLGRICRPGSVRADQLMFTESYAHVHHIVSNVSGELNEGLSPIDVLRAVFPGGSITGCPKFRCMQIIAELEGSARGAYTGALGYLNRDGSMDLNILIRSIAMNATGLEFRAGAGIVADSDRQLELQETRAKARGLIAALQVR